MKHARTYGVSYGGARFLGVGSRSSTVGRYLPHLHYARGRRETRAKRRKKERIKNEKSLHVKYPDTRHFTSINASRHCRLHRRIVPQASKAVIPDMRRILRKSNSQQQMIFIVGGLQRRHRMKLMHVYSECSRQQRILVRQMSNATPPAS